MTTDNPKMEIIKAPTGDFALLERTAMTDALDLIDEHLRAADFSVQNLSKIRLATGGAINFRCDSTDGEETPKRLTGIITAARQARAYWKSKDLSGKPPDCSSTDGFVGIGKPGGNCRSCPLAKWDSAPPDPDGNKGGGKACRELRQVLFLTGDQLLPHLLSISPTSIKRFDAYTLGLLSEKKVPYWAAITELTLEKATSDHGKPYAKIVFRPQTLLTLPERQLFRPYHERMKELLATATVDASAYEISGEYGPEPPSPVAAPPDNSDIPF